RLQDKASLDHDLFSRLQSFEYRGLTTFRLSDTDKTNREPVGRSPYEDDVLAVDLLDGVRGHEQRRLAFADRNLRIGQHFRFEPHSGVVQHNPNLHNAGRLVHLLAKISNFPWEALAGYAGYAG